MKINDLLADILGSDRMAKKLRGEPAALKTSKKQGDFDTLLQKETGIKAKGEATGNSPGAKVAFSGEAKERAGIGSRTEPPAGNRMGEKELDVLAERLAAKAGWLPEKGIFAGGAMNETEQLPELTQKEKAKGLLRLWMDLRQGPSPDGLAKAEDGPKTSKGDGSFEDTQKDLSVLSGGYPEAAAALSAAPEAGISKDSKAPKQGTESVLPESTQTRETGHTAGQNRLLRATDGWLLREMSSEPYIKGALSEEESAGRTNAAFARAEILRRFEALVREHGIGKPDSSLGPVSTEGPNVDGSLVQKGDRSDFAAFSPFVPGNAGAKEEGGPIEKQDQGGVNGFPGSGTMPETAVGISKKTKETSDKPFNMKDLTVEEASRTPRGETTTGVVLGANPADAARGSAIERTVALSEGMAQVIEVIRNRNGHKGRMVLEPPELGTVRIEIQSLKDQVRLHLFVENAQARDLVDQSMDVLRQSLSRQGLTLAETMVDIDAGGNGGHAAWGSDAASDASSGPALSDAAKEPQEPGEVIARLDIDKGLLNWIA